MFIRIPKTVDSTTVVGHLRQKYDILVLDGKRFLVGSQTESDSVENGIRLSIAYPNLEDVKNGFELVCKALKELCG